MKLRARLTLADRDEESAEACASALRSMGFEVELTSGRGVTFCGPAALFEEAFDQSVVLDPSPHFTSAPKIPEHCRKAASVYFPTPPTYYDQET